MKVKCYVNWQTHADKNELMDWMKKISHFILRLGAKVFEVNDGLANVTGKPNSMKKFPLHCHKHRFTARHASYAHTAIAIKATPPTTDPTITAIRLFGAAASEGLAGTTFGVMPPAYWQLSGRGTSRMLK